MPGYAVYHTEKGTGAGGGTGNHIDRVPGMEHTYPHADPARRHLNREYVEREDFKAASLPEAIAIRMKEGYTAEKAIRKDAVRYLEHILTGSHEQMTALAKDPAKLDQWVKQNYKFIAEEFGQENIVRFTLHMDELTPHIHAVTVPLKDGKLTAKEVMGNSLQLKQRQDKYAAMMHIFGLERGMERTGVKHEDAKEYYARINAAKKDTKDLNQAVEQVFDSVKIHALNIPTAKATLKAEISALVVDRVKSAGAEQIAQNKALKAQFKAKEAKSAYADLVAAAAKLKESTPISDYFSSLANSGKLRFDGRHGNETYYAIPGQNTGSISVNEKKNLWFDHANGTGGDLISAVKKFENLGFTDAVLKLTRESGSIMEIADKKRLQTVEKSAADDQNETITITAELNTIQHPALIQYLNSRRQSPQDLKGIAKELHWNKGDKRYFGIGFPDHNGNYAVRSASFKGNIKAQAQMPMGYTKVKIPGSSERGVLVFEGAFDLLAYRKLNPGTAFTGLILHSVSKLPGLMEAIKTAGKVPMGNITLMLDNDQAGKAATAKMKELYPEIRDGSNTYQNYKDLSERWEDPKGERQQQNRGLSR